MSRIDELIAELCPRGVTFKELGEIGATFGGLTGKSKADFSSGNARFVSYVNVFNNIAVNINADDYVNIEPGERQRTLQRADIIFTGSSETPDEVATSSVVTRDVDHPLYLNSFSIGYRLNDPSILDPEFSKHLFRSGGLRKQLKRTASGVTRFNVSKARLTKVRIPVPPIKVQREIVRVLDLHAALEVGLREELQAESRARRKQYDFSVSKIVSSIDAERAPLRDLGNWRGGMTPSKSNERFWEAGTIPWLASMDVSESRGKAIRGRVTPAALAETSLRVIPAPAVVVVMRSNILRRVLPIGLTAVDATVNQDVKALLPREGIHPEYIYQVLRVSSEQIRAATVRMDGSMAAVASQAFFDWSIPIPSLREQKRIATQLSAFEDLVNELDNCLSAELSARRKQYEYNRDQLLSFEELTA